MSEVVIDASAALAVIVTSQATAPARAFFVDHHADAYIAPHIFSWEMINALNRLVRRGAMTPAASVEARASLTLLEIDAVDAVAPELIFAIGDRASLLAIRPFDMAYLDLAVERQCALASRDGPLLAVARKYVQCFDLRGELPS